MFIRHVAVLAASVVLIASFVTGAWFALPPTVAQDPPPPAVQAAPKENKLQKLMKERYESAAKAYEAVWGEYSAGKTTIADPTYQWSLKTLEAQLDWKPGERVKAHVAHLDRMRPFHEFAKARFDVGTISPANYGTAEHGLLEAELWLEREKAKK